MPKAKKTLLRVRKTSFCPRCGKRFGNEARVLQHMNQPSSACSAFLNDISRPTVSQLLLSQAIPKLPIIHDARRACTSEAVNDMQMEFDDFPYDDRMDVHDMLNDTQESDLQPTGTTSPGNVEHFPGASQSYPGSKTFMDQFFSDKHSELRKENLFYPFASQEDWQVASWLLHSRLSMAAIDSFLSLDLVSYI